MKEERRKVEVRSGDGTTHGEVSVSLACPPDYRSAVILAHGAGNDMDGPLLTGVQERLAGNAVAAVRFNFLYSERGKRTPDRRAVLIDCWRSVADWVKKALVPPKLILSGKSMGGRMASYMVADGYPCNGIFFLGYPLHPPGKTGEPRKDHLPRIRVPLLFISGTRDALCDLDLLKPVINVLGARATLHIVEGGDHSFKAPKRSGRTEAEVREEIVGAILGWLGSL